MKKTIKSVSTSVFSLQLVQVAMNKYTIVFERGDMHALEYEAYDLKHALQRFDDILVIAEGH